MKLICVIFIFNLLLFADFSDFVSGLNSVKTGQPGYKQAAQ